LSILQVAEQLECTHQGVEVYRLGSCWKDTPDSKLYVMDGAARDRVQPVLQRLSGAGERTM
jgi:hypothetical protein